MTNICSMSFVLLCILSPEGELSMQHRVLFGRIWGLCFVCLNVHAALYLLGKAGGRIMPAFGTDSGEVCNGLKLVWQFDL